MIRKWVLAVLSVLLAWGIWHYSANHSAVRTNPVEDMQKRVYSPSDCKIRTEDFRVAWVSMVPLIKDRDTIKLLLNYYNCDNNTPKSGDIVVFENPFTKEKVIKRLAIIPGDKIESDKKTGAVKVNGKTLANSAKQEYRFRENELKWFDIYAKNGTVGSGTYFLLWDNTANSIDSREYGPVTREGILGKVEL